MSTESGARFVVRSLNLLAREFTKHNHKHHGNSSSDKFEARWQTQQRYLLSSAALLTSGADAICLQECAASFFEAELNPLGPKLLEE